MNKKYVAPEITVIEMESSNIMQAVAIQAVQAVQVALAFLTLVPMVVGLPTVT